MSNILKTLKYLAISLVFVRLLSLAFNPMIDISESRYAEMGRKMFVTGNFVTPYTTKIDDSRVVPGTTSIDDVIVEPFWGKPPLSFWGTAISYTLFGVNDFAARLPHFLFLLGVVVLAYFFVRRNFDELTARISTVILLSCTVFLYLMGGVMTDPALCFTMTICFVSFWEALHASKDRRLWGYLFFVGLGLALLAKGPIGVILVGLATGAWCIFKNKWNPIWKKIPWITGTLLMLAVALPWYILAELRTPGFLEYFIIGEHYERFLNPHWRGDLYGRGQGGFHGIIWLFYAVSILPWGLYACWVLCFKKDRDLIKRTALYRDDKLFYLVCWILSPLVFFTPSGNTIFPYALPAIAPTAILMGHIIARIESPVRLGKFKLAAALNIALFSSMILMNAFVPELTVRFLKTDKWLWQAYLEQRESKDVPMFYLDKQRFSGEFYSGQQAKVIRTTDLPQVLSQTPHIFLVVQEKHLKQLADSTEGYVLKVVKRNKDLVLYEVNR